MRPGDDSRNSLGVRFSEFPIRAARRDERLQRGCRQDSDTSRQRSIDFGVKVLGPPRPRVRVCFSSVLSIKLGSLSNRASLVKDVFAAR